MLPLPDGRVFLRWMFVALGLGIVCVPDFTVRSLLRAPQWAAYLYPHNPSASAGFIAGAYVFTGLAPLLCLATFIGLKLNKGWGRWTGAAASALLLLGFPLLSVAGAVGLYAMFTKPRPPDPRPHSAQPRPAPGGHWTSRRDSLTQPFITGIAMILGFQALALLTLYAQRNGMPVWNPSLAWWSCFLLSLLAQAALHELGHVAAAWTVYFRVRSIAVGPFTLRDDGYGFRFRLEWKRLLDSEGCLGAAPVSEDDLAAKQIAVVSGGPLLSLLTGGLFLLAFLALPGTGWEEVWLILAFNAVLGICLTITNLLPLGCSDGAALYHLLRDTPAGRQLMDQIKTSLVREQAGDAHLRADFQKEVELRELALHRAQEDGERDPMAIALCHQALGHARLALEDWPRAQAEFLKCLKFAPECALDPAIEANSWWGLQRACIERYWSAAAERAGAAAVKALGEHKPDRNPVALAVARTMLAQVHLRAGAHGAALAEAAGALATLPQSHERLTLRAAIFAVQAQAHLFLGAEGPGMEAAREAAAILSSAAIPEASRNLAYDEFGALGEALWKAGQSGTAIDMLRLAVTQLESGGAMAAAAKYRVKLAAALCALGRPAEALYALPSEETLPPSGLRCLLGERAAIHMAGGRPQEAAADARALAALWQQQTEPATADGNGPLASCQPQPPAAIEIAAAEALLARACLESGNLAEAEPLARQAAAVLAEWGHPGAGACRITLALATRERSPGAFEEAFRLIESAPLLSPAEKARRLEAERARIGGLGPGEGSITVERPVQLAGD